MTNDKPIPVPTNSGSDLLVCSATLTQWSEKGWLKLPQPEGDVAFTQGQLQKMSEVRVMLLEVYKTANNEQRQFVKPILDRFMSDGKITGRQLSAVVSMWDKLKALEQKHKLVDMEEAVRLGIREESKKAQQLAVAEVQDPSAPKKPNRWAEFLK